MALGHLYIRVSTDEQADKGFSQRDQEERLRSYCKTHSIEIGKVIFEDYSAKTFLRPEWTKLISELKKTKGKNCDYIIFTKWDRFTRNTMDGYNVINQLMGYGIIPMAIEQPLDLTIPEQKLMLAVYLSMPEVENDRRGLNVKYGMRRGRKEGRWMGMALPGYKNRTREDGSKYISLNQPEAKHMKWCFETIAKDIYPTEHVWSLAKQKGLKCSRMSFWAAIRNPCYCGKIIVPKMGNEEELIVKGLHEPLISESLFNDVQDVLEGRKKNQFIKQTTPKQLPLRSFMICPECNRILTGSASKGRSEYYYYYHCKRPCQIRFKADEVNDYFDAVLRQFVPKPGMAALYRDVVCDTYNNSNGAIQEERKNFIQQITDQNNRVTKSRELLLKDIIDGDEYRNLKVEAEKTIGKLEAKLKDLNEKIAHDLDVFGIVDKAIENLKNIAELYKNADMEGKQFIIGSIFPKKFVFDGEIDRTAPMNLAFHLIYQINSKLQKKKAVVKSKIRFNYGQVPGAGVEPARFPTGV
ncbi:MAG: recombinase family protein [Flavobacterium sp.]|nr:MAG: recombinase family protein [Flavobacterium sp.]